MRLVHEAVLLGSLALAAPAGLPDYDEEIWQDLAELAVDDGLSADLLAVAPAVTATVLSAPPPSSTGLAGAHPALTRTVTVSTTR